MHDKLLVPLSPWTVFAVGPGWECEGLDVTISHILVYINESGVFNHRSCVKIGSIIITKSVAVQVTKRV